MKKLISNKKTIDRYCFLTFILSIINVAYIIIFYKNNKYLPEPFLHDKSDTFMDFYYPLFWALHDGAYSIWHSVYPPVNFVILKIYHALFLMDLPEVKDANELRKFSRYYPPYFIFIYISLFFFTIQLSFTRILDSKNRLLVFIALLLSPPVLFGLERGNLIFFSLLFFAIYIQCHSVFLKILILSLLINIKPYFAVIYLMEILRRGNRDIILMTPLNTLIVFLISEAIFNQDAYLIIPNLLGFASKQIFSPYEIFSFPSTVIAFGNINRLVTNINLPIYLLYIPKILVYVLLLLCLRLFAKYKINSNYSSIFVVIFLTNYSISTGGYGIIYYIAIAPLLYITREFKILYLVYLGLFLGIWDFIPLFSIKESWGMNIYLSEQFSDIDVNFRLGSVVRPIVNFMVLCIYYNSLRSKFVK